MLMLSLFTLLLQKEKVKSLEVTPVKKFSAEADSVHEKLSDQSPAQHQATCPLTPCSGTPDTQALQDLMELAEEGMTLTQYGYTTYTAAGYKSGNIGILSQDDIFFYNYQALTVPCSLVKDNAVEELPSSGFVPETNDNKTPKKTPVRISFSCIHLYSVVIGYE